MQAGQRGGQGCLAAPGLGRKQDKTTRGIRQRAFDRLDQPRAGHEPGRIDLRRDQAFVKQAVVSHGKGRSGFQEEYREV